MGIKTKLTQQRGTLQTRLTGFKTELPKKMYGNQTVPDNLTLSDVPDYVKKVIPNRIALYDKISEVDYQKDGRYAFDVITPSLQNVANDADNVRIELFDFRIIYKSSTVTNVISLSFDYMITTACFFENKLYVAIRNRASLGSYIIALTLDRLQTLTEINMLTETIQCKFDNLYTKKILIRNNKIYYMNYTSITNDGIYKIYNNLGKYLALSIIDDFCFIGGMYYILESPIAIVTCDSQEVYMGTKIADLYEGMISCKNNLFAFLYDEATKTTKIRYYNPSKDSWALLGNNLLTGARDFSGSGWEKTVSATIIPQGYNGMSVYTSNVKWQACNKVINAIAGERYRFSCYVKTTNKDTVIMTPRRGENDLNTASVIYLDATYRKPSANNTWVHTWITFEVTGSGTMRPAVFSETDGVEYSVCGMVLEKINGLDFGNVFTDPLNYNSSAWQNRSSFTIATETYNGLTVLTHSKQWYGLTQNVNVKAGEKYRFSAYIKASKAEQIGFVIKDGNQGDGAATPGSITNIGATTEWKLISQEFTVTYSGILRPAFENLVAGSQYWICGLKLEKIDDVKDNSSTALVSSVNTKFVSWYCVNDCIYAIDNLNTIYISNDGFRWREYLKSSSITGVNTQLYINRHIAASKYSGLQLVLSAKNIILDPNIYTGWKDFSGDKWINKDRYTVEGATYNGLTVLSAAIPFIGLHQRFTAKAGDKYRISAYIKSTVSNNVYYETKNTTMIVNSRSITLVPNEWNYVRCEFTTNENSEFRAIFQSNNTNRVSICGIRLEKVESFNPGYVCVYTQSFASGENVAMDQMCYSDEGDQLIGCRNIYDIADAPMTEAHTTSLDYFFYMSNTLYAVSQGTLLKYDGTKKVSLGTITPNNFTANMQSGNFIYQTGEGVIFYTTNTAKKELWYITPDNVNKMKVVTLDVTIDNVYAANGFIYIQSGNLIYEISITYVSGGTDTVTKTLVYTLDSSLTLIRSHVNYPNLYYIGATTTSYTFGVYNLATKTIISSKTITEVCPRTGYGLSAIVFVQRKDSGVAVSVNKKLLTYNQYEKIKVKDMPNYIKLVGVYNNQFVYLLNNNNTTSFRYSPVFISPNDMLKSSALPIGSQIMPEDVVIVNKNGIFVKFDKAIARISNKCGTNIVRWSRSGGLPMTLVPNIPISNLVFFGDIKNAILDIVYVSLDNDIVINGQTTNRLRIVEKTTGVEVLTGDATNVTIDPLTNQFITIAKISDKTPAITTPTYNYIYTNKK